jgi:serine/threonine-protein kinase
MTERTGTVDGRRLGGRYLVETLLATGGMGEVWVARDLLLDRAVAVKVLGGALAGDTRAAERLRREARAAGRLEHPNIARVLDLGEHDGRPYLIMELLDGESLAARIDRAGPMPSAEAARVVAAVADALEAAHQAGVVHRDVKPGNVFLTSTGAVKVLDFGIASAAGDAAITTGDLLGTAAYLAPERVLGQRATSAADIYALGVVLYELLAGHRPFEAGSEVELAMAHVNADPPSLRQVAPSTPAFLVAACHRAMAKDPSARPPSAAVFAQLVRAQGPPSPATRPLPVTGAAPTTRPRSRPVPAPAPAGRLLPAPIPTATAAAAAAERRRTGNRRPRSPRRRGLLVALLLAGALLASLPALAGGLPLLVRERVQGPLAVLEPETATPGTGEPRQPVGTDATDATPEPGPAPAGEAGLPPITGPGADGDRQLDPGDGDDRDRDGDSSGSGRSGGGDSGGGGSSGPG